MTVTASDLLKALGSGLRPAGAANTPAAAPADAAGFADLLAQVRAGKVSSHEPLRTARGLDTQLTQEQLDRLAVATDAAEASGASRLLAVVDQTAVTIDVASRTIQSAEPWPTSQVTTDIDAAVVVPSGGDKELRALFGAAATPPASAAAGPGIAGIRNSSIADLLARLNDQPSERHAA
jgi:hypothetical protein